MIGYGVTVAPLETLLNWSEERGWLRPLPGLARNDYRLSESVTCGMLTGLARGTLAPQKLVVSENRRYIVEGLHAYQALVGAFRPAARRDDWRLPAWFDELIFTGLNARGGISVMPTRGAEFGPCWLPLSCVGDRNLFKAWTTRLQEAGHLDKDLRRRVQEDATRLVRKIMDHTVLVCRADTDDVELLRDIRDLSDRVRPR